MAHELDKTYGEDNAIGYIGQLPWHRYGTLLPPSVSVEEAIELVPAVNFETKTVDMFHMDTFLYGGKLVEGHKAVIRSDTGEALGVVSPRYKPIQIRDQWAGLDPLIDAGLASIETLGSIKNGRYIWGMVKFNSDEIPEWDELQELVGEIQPYGLVYDVKDGSGAAVLANTNVRVVCNNTLEAARAGLTNCIKIKHVGDTAAKVREAADDMWGGIIEGLNMLRVRYMTLDNIHLMNRS